MKKIIFNDLRDFLQFLEQKNLLKTITDEISPDLEISALCDKILKNQGAAVLFTNPKNYQIPLLANLFGTTERIAYGLGLDLQKYCQNFDTKNFHEKSKIIYGELRKIGELLAALKEPKPPEKFSDAVNMLPLLKNALYMKPRRISSNKAACHEVILQGEEIDLLKLLPIQHCWSGDVAPLITWGMVVTKGISKSRQNIGIYRQQVIGKNKLIMRWLAHRGGALDFLEFQNYHLQNIKNGKNTENLRFPISVVIGCDPATILAAVTPIPDTLSEYQFAGLLRGASTQLTKSISNDLDVPANAEIVLEGYLQCYSDPKVLQTLTQEQLAMSEESALEGPYGDHTGYYNETARFPVFTVEKITHRKNPIYLSTYTGKPPDEPAILGVALNEVFVPLLQKQFPEIVDFYLPPEGCSYRLAIVAIKKEYPGHAKRIMFGVWSFLRQFMYTKFIIIVDAEIDIRSWQEVIWAITTRCDPKRDSLFVENTPIDYLDFASPIAGLGSKMGIDATNKIYPIETQREWGREIKLDNEKVNQKVAELYKKYFE